MLFNTVEMRIVSATIRTVLAILAFSLSGISVAEDRAQLIALSFQEFDQSPQGGWRKLEQAKALRAVPGRGTGETIE